MKTSGNRVRLCVINGSLRGEKASSKCFLDYVVKKINQKNIDVHFLQVKTSVKNGYAVENFRSMASADALVVAFPLFCYTLPGALTQLLEEYYEYFKHISRVKNNQKMYVIINCGFPEPDICAEAIRVMKNFCLKSGFEHRFSLAIGGGPVTALTIKLPLVNPALKKAFSEIAREIQTGYAAENHDRYFTPVLPKKMILSVKRHFEKKSLELKRASG